MTGVVVGSRSLTKALESILPLALDYTGAVTDCFGGSYAIAQDYVGSAGCVMRIGYEKQEICETVNELSREVENDTITFNGKGRIVST